MASSEACCRWWQRGYIKLRETPPRSMINIDAMLGGGGCSWAGVGSLDIDEAVEEGQGRVEQKGRLKSSMNLWRATLLNMLALTWGENSRNRQGRMHIHALIAAVL